MRGQWIVDTHRFDGRVIRVDMAADRSAPRGDGGYYGRGGYRRGGHD